MDDLRSAVIYGSVPAFRDSVANALRAHAIHVHTGPEWPTIPVPSITLTVGREGPTKPPWGTTGWVIGCEITTGAVRAAVRRGAHGVVDIRLPPCDIAEHLIGIASGTLVLPTEIVRDLSHHRVADDIVVSIDESNWLCSLANGHTISDVARDAGLSDRELHRRLRRLYRRLGVVGREGAVALVANAGVIEPTPSGRLLWTVATRGRSGSVPPEGVDGITA